MVCATAAVDMSSSRPRVLIVEDDHDLRRLYAVGLTKRGYEVLLAGTGADALDRVETDRPDIVLVDISMPVMDGWELIERLNPPKRGGIDFPVIVVTGRKKPEDYRGQACIVDWIEKPVSIETLVRRVESHLGRDH
ncbi:MAG: response regulator [Thermoanaerobaculia bacterium]|nr:response regulator [Thermoanaerobaculia bacterium]